MAKTKIEVTHHLECSHKIVEDAGNRAGQVREKFCEHCRGYMNVLRSSSREVEVDDESEDQPLEALAINIAEDETPEIHHDLSEDDAPL